MFESGLFALLKASSAVTSIVDDGIYFTAVPKGGSYPSIVINTVSTVYMPNLDSTLPQQERRVQFTCISAASQIAARQLAAALKSVLVDYTGTLADGTVVSMCVPDLDMDIPYEVGATGYAFGVALDMTFFLTEAA